MRLAGVLMLLLGSVMSAQSTATKQIKTDAEAAFAVATIKPSDPYSSGKGMRIRGRRFAAVNATLSYLIQYAYGFHARQIRGGPEWLDEAKFDIAAIPEEEGQPTNEQWKAMLQKLLAERFALRFHHATQELSVYLLIQKDASKLSKSKADAAGLPDLTFRRGEGVIRLPARNASMDDFAHVMQRNVVDRPIVDRTGLLGRFDFILTFTPSEYQLAMTGGGAPSAVDNAPPELFTALEQQLGLKLQPAKVPVDVLVIDHAEKPSAN